MRKQSFPSGHNFNSILVIYILSEERYWKAPAHGSHGKGEISQLTTLSSAAILKFWFCFEMRDVDRNTDSHWLKREIRDVAVVLKDWDNPDCKWQAC